MKNLMNAKPLCESGEEECFLTRFRGRWSISDGSSAPEKDGSNVENRSREFHGITVTSADLDYHGSITLDPDQCDLAGVYPLEFVGFGTRPRVIVFRLCDLRRTGVPLLYPEWGHRRKCQPGDQVIVAASGMRRLGNCTISNRKS